MTRSEALNIVREISHSSWSDRTMADFVDILIALKVLKVEETQLDLKIQREADVAAFWLARRAEADRALQDLCVPH